MEFSYDYEQSGTVEEHQKDLESSKQHSTWVQVKQCLNI